MLAAMEAVFDYRIPVLHPLAVHLPLTLLLTAALAALVWMLKGSAFWRRCCAFLVLLSVPAAVFAYVTGDPMLDRSEGVPIIDELAPLHEQMALYTLVSTAIAAVSIIAYSIYVYRRGPSWLDPVGARVAVGLLVLIAAALVAWTGHIGSVMTWGVGKM